MKKKIPSQTFKIFNIQKNKKFLNYLSKSQSFWRKKYLGNDKGFQNIIECIDYYEKIENDLINNNNLPEKLLKKYYPYAEYLD